MLLGQKAYLYYFPSSTKEPCAYVHTTYEQILRKEHDMLPISVAMLANNDCFNINRILALYV